MTSIRSEKFIRVGEAARYPLGYNACLDGLRALAVLVVILSHYHIPGFVRGGYGVDIFFVLSGFLITRVLFNGVEKQQSLFQFYWRRFLRLMPALVWMCLVFAAFTVFFKGWVDPQTMRNDIFAALTYVTNWIRAYSLGVPKYFGHCWSLAIEEQFYLLWPLFFLLFASRQAYKPLLMATGLLLLASLVWPLWVEYRLDAPMRVYNGFDTHSSGLLMGCCLAIVAQVAPHATAFKLVGRFWPLALLLFIYLVCGRPSWDLVLARHAAGAAAVVFILVACYAPHSLFGKAMGLKPVVWIGKISYGLYLWHYPVFLMLHFQQLPWAWIAVIGIPLSFAAAAFSYWFVEQPLMNLRESPALPAKHLGRVTVSLMMLGMLAGMAYFFQEAIRDGLSSEPRAITAFEPKAIKTGSQFNIQHDGESYMWMKTTKTLPQGAKVFASGKKLKTNVSGRTLTALLPRDLLSDAGRHEIVLKSSNGTILAPAVSFEVVEDRR